MAKYTKFVGLDVHKESISVAIADTRNSEVRFYGTLPNTLDGIVKLAKRLSEDGAEVSFVYEAGPCGYPVHRKLLEAGYACMVVAPSLIPKKAGDRVKTDRRDAQSLARLHRAGELTAVWVPGPEQEAMRDLARLREDLKRHERHVKQQIGGFLLRNGRHYTEKISRWTQKHRSWIDSQRFEQPAQQIVLQGYMTALDGLTDQVKAVVKEMERALETWSLAAHVHSLMGLKGVDFVTAFTIMAEIGDLSRFDSATQFMAYLGLVPSEASSGGKTKRGSLTKAGNGHVRCAITEAAWSYRLKPLKSKSLLKRQEGLDLEVCQISWEAQKRLTYRYRHMTQGGKKKTVAVTAIARELAGFIWAIGCHMSGRPVKLTGSDACMEVAG